MTPATVRLAGSGMPEGPAGPPLLAPEGPRVVLGGADALIGPVAPAPDTLFGPRAALLHPSGALVVADTGHHRVLIWSAAPARDGAAADVVLGQPGFEREGRNALGEASASTLNVPAGLGVWPDADGPGLLVADSWNNRVLVWRALPRRSGAPADLVLGQASCSGQSPNRGGAVGPATLHWPSAAFVHAGRLVVCDTGNRRVLVWNTLPERDGQPADMVIGQPDLWQRSDNGGAAADLRGLRWPHDACVLDGDLVVADAGDNRLSLFEGVPERDHAPAARLLGQLDAAHVDHNQSRYWPTAATLNMPYGVDAAGGRLYCADTANSRLLGFARPARHGEAALRLTGQRHFAAKGDNAWGPPGRGTLCWPYGLRVGRGRHAGTVAVADTGNHRVCLWRDAWGAGGGGA